MPIYDYRCLDCKKRFEVFMTYADYGKKAVVCKFCNSENITRKINRVRFARSEESRLENFADPTSLEGLEDDPVALGRMMRKMSGELGEEMPEEFNEVVNRLEAGQSPEDIEKELPELGDDSGSGVMDSGFDDD
jgi:putative FmdB family regulatory protein